VQQQAAAAQQQEQSQVDIDAEIRRRALLDAALKGGV
jgi:hypothetical protein